MQLAEKFFCMQGLDASFIFGQEKFFDAFVEKTFYQSKIPFFYVSIDIFYDCKCIIYNRQP